MQLQAEQNDADALEIARLERLVKDTSDPDLRTSALDALADARARKGNR
jgi:hypothetical protein